MKNLRYMTVTPSATLFEKYDSANNASQAKQMLEDLAYLGAVAQKSTEEGGKYVIWVKKYPNKPLLTHELYESPQKDSNREKYGDLASPQCMCCYKPIKNVKYTVHMNTAWLATHIDVVTEENCVELTGRESQGGFEIGECCAKKIPHYFTNRL